MAKLKGLKKLNKAITAEVATFGIKKAVCETEFAYYFSDNHIGYKAVVDISDEIFDAFVEERFEYHVEQDFPISLLHEIGHRETGDDIDGGLYEWCLAEKERINKRIAEAEDEETLKHFYFQYFNLPDEIMATQWAVNFAKRHPKKIKKMWKNIEKAFHAFYNANNLEAEEIADVI